MTELYRGLLLVLTNKFNELILAFRTHIQSFKQNTKDEHSELNFGVLGFWNLLLEIIFTIFSLLCLLIGVSLVSLLAVVFYPGHAILQYVSIVLKNIRHPSSEIPILQDQIKISAEPPVIIKKEK